MTPVFVVFVLGLLLGLPVAFVMGISGFVGLLMMDSLPLVVLPQRLFNGIDSFPLMAVPFFILAAEVMSASRISNLLLQFCNSLVAHIRGGLGHVNVLVSMLFAGISGSALADAAGPSAIVMRMMRKAGYQKDYAAALSAATSTIGPIIPPSIIMVVYAVSDSKVTVAGLFLAGVIPGVLMGAALALTNYIICRKNAPDIEQKTRWLERGKWFVKALPGLIMPGIILGGILLGVFTATEAGAVAVLYAFFVGFFVTKSIRLKHLPEIFIRSAILTSSVLLVVSMAAIFAWVLTVNQFPDMLVNFISGFELNTVAALFLLAVVILICGLFLDTLPAVIVLVPVLGPVAVELGIDPLQFAIMLTINLTIGMVTPPVGPVLFVISSVGQIKIEQVSRAILPFLLAQILVLVMIIVIPELSTWLPTQLGYWQ